MKIAIIGAGLSGANIYNLLRDDAHDITIFEKSRGAGGRCSTKYINNRLLDHGTPFFKPSNIEFIEFCDKKVYENILIKKDDYYYPVNGMNKICSFMIDTENLKRETKIVSCEYKDSKWHLKDDSNVVYGGFDKLCLTLPAPQILQMSIKLPEYITKQLKQVEYNSVATVMFYSIHNIKSKLKKYIDTIGFNNIVDNSLKYGYKDFYSYIWHMPQDAQDKNRFCNRDDIRSFLDNNLLDDNSIETITHFWKYATVKESLDIEYIYDDNISLAICGDYFGIKNLDSSYLSSTRLYKQKLSQL
jgi:predicted NAD/FAD-dependent oxidoreductase